MTRKKRRVRQERTRAANAGVVTRDVPDFPRIHLAAALLLALVAYANALGNNFVLDDIGIIVENPLVQQGANVWTVFTSGYWPSGASGVSMDPTLYRPLAILSFVLNGSEPGLNATAFHAVNVVLHMVATALVFVLALRVFKSAAPSLAAAAVFAVHPVHTEAVTGIVGRADVMATVFFLSSFLVLRRRTAFVDAERKRRLPIALGWGLIGAVAWLLGLFSKEIAATLPMVLALDDWLARREFPDERGATTRVLLVRYAPLAAAAVVYLLLRENAITGGSQIWPGFAGASTASRVLTASRVIMEYIGLFLFPFPLLADYWISEVPNAHSALNPAVFASIALWLATVVGLRLSKGDVRIILPIAWFFITIAPVSNVLFPIGVAKAERLLYLPSVGLCLLVGSIVSMTAARGTARNAGRVFLGSAVLIFVILTVRRNRDWKDNLTLAQATLKVSPESPLMNDVAAGEFMKRGEAQRALPLLQEAVRQAPGMAFVRTHLATVYSALGMRAESEAEYLEALRLNPSDADAHNNLGVLYLNTSRDELAMERFRSAIAIRPNFASPHSNLGALYLVRGDLTSAETELAEAVRLNPGSADARNNYGLVLARLGQRDRAAEQYREALRLDPGHQKAQANLSALERSPPTQDRR